MLTRQKLADAGYPKHAATLNWLEQHIGEHEQPAGTNTGTFVQSCQRATWLGGTRWAWCRALVLRARLKGGFTLPDQSAGAWDALKRAQKRGDALTPANYDRAIPGDEVIWSFGAGHSSTLERFELRSGGVYVHTIDGNVRDRVERCARPLSLVKGFVVWHESAKPVKAKPPRRQVVGSISGKRQLVTRKGRVLRLPSKKAGPAGVIPLKPGGVVKPPRQIEVVILAGETLDTSTRSNASSTVRLTTGKPKPRPKPAPKKKPAPKRAPKAAGSRPRPSATRSTPKPKPAPKKKPVPRKPRKA